MTEINEQKLGKSESDIEIEVITYAGIVEKMELYEGDKCSALLIQNFEDKRAVTPWRAVRVSAIN